MAWIEAHQGLARHPKTKRLARLLDLSVPTVIGHLFLLWWWALDYAQDGDLSRFNDDDICDAVDYSEDATRFVSALSAAGFLDEGSRHIHDWDEYAGRLLEKRRMEAERKQASRRRIGDVQTVSVGRPQDGARNTNSNTNSNTNDKNTRRASDDARPVEGSPETDEDTEHVTNGESLEVKTASGTAPTRTVDRSTTRHNAASFDAFWQAYPRKTAKGAAEAAWRKLKPDESLVAGMLAAVEVAKQSAQWQREGGQYIPLPSTWLNQRRWEDEHVAPALAERRGHSRLPPAADSRESKYDEIDIIRRRMARQELEARNNRGEVQ